MSVEIQVFSPDLPTWHIRRSNEICATFCGEQVLSADISDDNQPVAGGRGDIAVWPWVDSPSMYEYTSCSKCNEAYMS